MRAWRNERWRARVAEIFPGIISARLIQNPFSHIYFELKKMKGRTESYFKMF